MIYALVRECLPSPQDFEFIPLWGFFVFLLYTTGKLISSGVVEGLNNKAKVTMRKSHGFRTFRCLELALYHSLGKLPEPESTHEFF